MPQPPEFELDHALIRRRFSAGARTARDADFLAREVASYFRVGAARARVVEGEVLAAVRRWPEAAKTLGLSRTAQVAMAPAFRLAER